MPFKRQCPNCGIGLSYAHLTGYQRARRCNAVCRRCAATPTVIQQKLAEAEQKRVMMNSDKNIMAIFFSRIEKELSGSLGR